MFKQTHIDPYRIVGSCWSSIPCFCPLFQCPTCLYFFCDLAHTARARGKKLLQYPETTVSLRKKSNSRRKIRISYRKTQWIMKEWRMYSQDLLIHPGIILNNNSMGFHGIWPSIKNRDMSIASTAAEVSSKLTVKFADLSRGFPWRVLRTCEPGRSPTTTQHNQSESTNYRNPKKTNKKHVFEL